MGSEARCKTDHHDLIFRQFFAKSRLAPRASFYHNAIYFCFTRCHLDFIYIYIYIERERARERERKRKRKRERKRKRKRKGMIKGRQWEICYANTRVVCVYTLGRACEERKREIFKMIHRPTDIYRHTETEIKIKTVSERQRD